jgi:hypothetical protein
MGDSVKAARRGLAAIKKVILLGMKPQERF